MTTRDEIRERLEDALATQRCDAVCRQRGTHGAENCYLSIELSKIQADAVLGVLDHPTLLALLDTCPTDATESVALPRVPATPTPSVEDESREALIALCEAAAVPMDKWRNRDSASAQQQVGQALALLRAGCPFTVLRGQPTAHYNGHLLSDDKTLWVDISFRGFQAFEYGGGREDGYWDDETFYLPAAARLQEAAGNDWY